MYKTLGKLSELGGQPLDVVSTTVNVLPLRFRDKDDFLKTE